MEDNEFIDSEKVLYKSRCKLRPPQKEPEEANCVVTEGHVLIEAAEMIKIPLLRIKHCDIPLPSTSYSTQTQEPSSSTMVLTFLDNQNRKHKLSLEMAVSDATYCEYNLKLAIAEAEARWLESLPIEKRYVGFWRRFAAYLLDGIILNIISWILGFVLSFLPYWIGSVIAIVFVIGSIVYFLGFWVWQGATPGKMMMGVKIVKTDGSPIGIGRAILRYIGYFVSAITLYIGYLMIAWDSKKQGLHDKIAGTYVIKTG